MRTPAAPHREDIKAAIRKQYGSLRKFEEVRGLAPRSCNDVLQGKSRPETAMAMAAAVGIGIHKLFPGRYTSNGDTIIRPGRGRRRKSVGAR